MNMWLGTGVRISRAPSASACAQHKPWRCGCGAGGTVTGLHFDSFDNILVQLVGALYFL